SDPAPPEPERGGSGDPGLSRQPRVHSGAVAGRHAQEGAALEDGLLPYRPGGGRADRAGGAGLRQPARGDWLAVPAQRQCRGGYRRAAGVLSPLCAEKTGKRIPRGLTVFTLTIARALL